MAIDVLRPDALSSVDGRLELRIALPWIRSLPLASLHDLELELDGSVVPDPAVRLGSRVLEPARLAAEVGWWFLQDRLVVVAPVAVEPGAHEVAVRFSLAIPYLAPGPAGPLLLPFTARATLLPVAPAPHFVARDVA